MGSQDGLTALHVASGSGKGDSALVCEVLSKHMQKSTTETVSLFEYLELTFCVQIRLYLVLFLSRTDLPLIRTGLLVIRTSLLLNLPLMRTPQLLVMTQTKTAPPQLQCQQSLDREEPHR